MSFQVLPVWRDTAVRSPGWPAFASVASVFGSLVLAFSEAFGDQADSLVVSVAGYVLGSLVTSALVVVHRLLKQRASSDMWYSPRAWLDSLTHATLVAGLACGAWHAFVLATEIAKR